MSNWGYVYLMKGRERIKIGISGNLTTLKRREQRLNTISEYGVERLLLLRTRSPKNLESALHRKYAHKRVNGEWFALSSEDVRDIFNDNLKDVYESKI